MLHNENIFVPKQVIQKYKKIQFKGKKLKQKKMANNTHQIHREDENYVPKFYLKLP